MNKNKRLFLFSLFLIAPAMSFAFFCPTNFSQIDFGMTIDQITQVCGKPDTQKESTKPNENVPQEWTYYVPQTVTMTNNAPSNGTLKASVAFDSSGKAINISVNGIGVGSTTICGNTISLGDSRDSVKGSCGEPAFNNSSNNALNFNGPPPTKVVEFNYSSANPPVTLVFENGVLTSKK